jgi:hypothetical protein
MYISGKELYVICDPVVFINSINAPQAKLCFDFHQNLSLVIGRYILIYPQGCDVCNHLSLFLCVANHDKLLPGKTNDFYFLEFKLIIVSFLTKVCSIVFGLFSLLFLG